MPGVGFIRPSGDSGGVTTAEIEVYSDAGLTTPIVSADFGDTVYINIATTGITPTNHRFFICDNGLNFDLTEQASATLAHTVTSFEDIIIYAESDDGSIPAAALEAFEVSINADADANAFIAAHNVLSGSTMSSANQEIVQGVFQRFKGSFTTNGSDLWTLCHDNVNSRVYPLIPIDGSTVSADAYALDMIHLNEDAAYTGMIVTDFAVTGVTGGGGKYFLLDKAPADFGQNDLAVAAYVRTNIAANYSNVFGASNTKLIARSTTDKIAFKLNAATDGSVSNTDSRGAYIVNRIDSAKQKIYKNGTLLLDDNQTSQTPSSYLMAFHAINRTGVTPDRTFNGELSFYAQIPGLTTAQAKDLNEIIVWLQTQLSRNV